MTTYIRELERADLDMLIQDTPETSYWRLLSSEQFDEVVKHPAWVGFVDNQLVGAGGLVRLWPGLAEAWIAVTSLASRYPRFVLRTAYDFLDINISYYNLRRVEANIREDFTKAIKFATRLGFEYNCPRFKYGPNGETFYLFAKVM